MEDLFRNWASRELFDEQSFISKLHESHIWDDNEYWKLDNAIYDLTIKELLDTHHFEQALR
ncbi:Imm41 family immunity protein [Aeromonas salmonicida]|uniref:Imm41 family immunity protein n=1 Tax=Aeromonas salmonicida TaxID=645 RepID=UPI003A847CF6